MRKWNTQNWSAKFLTSTSKDQLPSHYNKPQNWRKVAFANCRKLYKWWTYRVRVIQKRTQTGKVGGPTSGTHLKQTPIFFEWCVIRCGSKKHAPIRHDLLKRDWKSLLSILCSIVYTIGGGIWSFNEKENLHLWSRIEYSNDVHNYEENELQVGIGIANHLPLLACFISYEKWVQS